MTSLKRSQSNPAEFVVVASTRRCNASCFDCYAKKCNLDLPLSVIDKNVSPYLRGKEATSVGGEMSMHPEWCGILQSMLSRSPKSLDLFTNGRLFQVADGAFWDMAANGKLKIVYSFDRHHVNGLARTKGSEGWLERAICAIKEQWASGSRVGFVISSTRFGDKGEPEVEEKIHALCAKHGVMIGLSPAENEVSWESAFRWAKERVVRLISPLDRRYFVIGNKNAPPKGEALEFLVCKGGMGYPFSLKETVVRAMDENYNSAKYGFIPSVLETGLLPEGTKESSSRCISIRRFTGTPKKDMPSTFPSTQIFVDADGGVYTCPATFRTKPSEFNVKEKPLSKIAKELLA